MIEKYKQLEIKSVANEEERDLLISQIKSGVDTPFWKFVVEILDRNIGSQKDILLTADLQKTEFDVLQSNVFILEFLKNLPKFQLEQIGSKENNEDEEDEEQKAGVLDLD